MSPTWSSWLSWRQRGGQGPGSQDLCWTSSNWQSVPSVSGIRDLTHNSNTKYMFIMLVHISIYNEIHLTKMVEIGLFHDANEQNVLIWAEVYIYIYVYYIYIICEFLFLTCIWFSGHAHRKRCMMPNWTRNSNHTLPGSCDWCRRAVHQNSCSCCSPLDASCRLPKSVPVSPHSHTAKAAHTSRPAATGLDTHIH